MLYNHFFVSDCSDSISTIYPKNQILESSKLKEFADDNFKFNENFWVENTVTSNFSLSHSVFQRLVLLTRKNQGFFEKELTVSQMTNFRLS